MKKLDRRIRRTRKALSDALIGLAKEHDYDRITVRQLTERADVGYATFYRHYSTIDEIYTARALGVVQEVLLGFQPGMSLREECLVVYKTLDRHRDACLIGLDLPREHPAVIPVWDEVRNLVMKHHAALDCEQVPLVVTANHLITSFVELLRWWLTQDHDYDVEQMATMQTQLVAKIIDSLAPGPPSAS